MRLRVLTLLVLGLVVTKFAAAQTAGVYKAFGYSADSRYFLYLKSRGGFPTFTLVCFDVFQKTERPIAEGVHSAAWAPNTLKLAYISLETGTWFRLIVHDLATGSREQVFAGALDPAYLEWSQDGNRLLFVSVAALTENSFEDRSYEQRLHQYDVDGGRESVVKLEASEPDISSQVEAAAGHLFKLPFQGSAYLVQGGAAYKNGVCDGGHCLVIAHSRGLGSALDWQQTPEDGQGSTHVLAVADGTVAATANDVTCNSVNRNCVVGHDDYRSPCEGNDGAGNYVLIGHADGTYSLYAHLESGSVRVRKNQVVTQGTYLGDQGHSGSANSPTKYHKCGDHLHFQRQKSPAVFSPSVVTDFEEAPCAMSCLTSYTSANVEKGTSTSAPLSVTLAPSNVIGSLKTVANKVLLGSPAPAGGAKVTLSSSDPARASVPAVVNVPAGMKWVSFPVTVNGNVTIPMPVVISAARGGTKATAELTVSPATVAHLGLAASAIAGGKAMNGNEVALNGMAAHNIQVALTSSKPAVVQVPATVTVEEGQTFALFSLQTTKVSARTTVTIKASGGSVIKTATLTIKPAP